MQGGRSVALGIVFVFSYGIFPSNAPHSRFLFSFSPQASLWIKKGMGHSGISREHCVFPGPFSLGLSSLFSPDVEASAACSSSPRLPPTPRSPPTQTRSGTCPEPNAVLWTHSLSFSVIGAPGNQVAGESSCGTPPFHFVDEKRGEKLAESTGFCCWVSVAAIFSAQAFAFPFGYAFLAQCQSSRAVFLYGSRCP